MLAGLVIPREIESGYAFRDAVASLFCERFVRQVEMGMMLVLALLRL